MQKGSGAILHHTTNKSLREINFYYMSFKVPTLVPKFILSIGALFARWSATYLFELLEVYFWKSKDRIILITTECATILNDTSGEISLRTPGMAIGISSHYYYENDIENDCIWLIQMGVQQLIQINFLHFWF